MTQTATNPLGCIASFANIGKMMTDVENEQAAYTVMVQKGVSTILDALQKTADDVQSQGTKMAVFETICNNMSTALIVVGMGGMLATMGIAGAMEVGSREALMGTSMMAQIGVNGLGALGMLTLAGLSLGKAVADENMGKYNATLDGEQETSKKLTTLMKHSPETSESIAQGATAVAADITAVMNRN
jgi:hypothetical protein